IDDVSTQIAALRTGQIDYLGVGFAQGPNLIRTNPELVYKGQPSFDDHIYLRQDQGYFVDKNVRSAMMKAVDPDAIIRDLYGGDAEWWNFPYTEDCAGRYTAFEDLPADIQELYTYDPEASRQLLADAGYPDGFKIEILTYLGLVDMLSIYQQYFSEVGIDMTIDLVDYGAFCNIAGEKEWELLASGHGASCGGEWTLLADGDHYWNYSVVDDKHIEEVLLGLPSEILEPEEYDRQMKELGIYWAGEVKYMNLPVPSDFKFWQPWLKRQDGEFFIGTWQGYTSSLIYAWIDQDLKFEMTGER
ncbi:MAG: ABC transporter substrate-binding protein, partial [Candidatus Bathyanammoxibius sp.]